MTNRTERLNNFLFKEIDPIGLAVFRIAYFAVVLLEVLHFYKWRHVFFDRVPYEIKSEINFQFIFLFWFISVVFLIIGFRTRIASIVNYIFTVIIFSSSADFEYHIFYTYVGVAFLAMFIPLSGSLSADRLLDILRAGKTGEQLKVPKALRIHYLAPIFVGIGLVYYDSIFFKLDAKMWINGIGMWMPASLPMATWNDTSWLLNQKYLVIFLNYFVIFFEFVFLFVFWIKRLRLPIMVIGILFHLGIYLQYPIPYFAWAYIGIYLLFFPVGLLRKLLGYLLPPVHLASPPNSLITAAPWLRQGALSWPLGILPLIPLVGPWLSKSCDAIVELSASMATACEPASRLVKRFWIYLLLFFTVSQFIITWYSPYSIAIRKNIGFTSTEWIEETPLFEGFYSVIINFFGITHHGVFTDYHFMNFNHIFHAKYVNSKGEVHDVPLLNEKGFTDAMINGTTWRNIAFNVITQNVKQDKFEKGIKPYLHFYIVNYEGGDYNGYFKFFGKEIEVPSEWKPNHLRNQIAIPWTEVGSARFEGNQLHFTWNQTMQDILDKELMNKKN
jgi:hypothetical protein